MLEMEAAYKAAEYHRAAHLGEALVQKQPHNALARYYLGNAYVELHQMEQAEIEYQACIDISPDSELARNCHAALKSIGRYMSAAQSNSAARAVGANSGNNGQLNEEQRQIMQEAQDRIKRKENDANREVEQLRALAQDDINSIPTRSYRMVGARMRSGTNPYLAPAKADITEQLNEKISRIKYSLDKDIQSIKNDAQQRIDSVRK